MEAWDTAKEDLKGDLDTLINWKVLSSSVETHPEWSPAERDRRELQFIDRVGQDIRNRGPDSSYMREILGYAANE